MSNTKLLLSSKCERCGSEGAPHLSISGPHVRMSCGACGFYIKFVGKQALPSVPELRAEIWRITNQAVDVIERAKKACGFQDVQTSEWRAMQYYKLYKYLLDEQERMAQLTTSFNDLHNDL